MKRQLSSQVNSRHARIVLLSTGSVRNREIARLCDCTPQWVRRILHRFNAQGIDGISWYPFYADHTGQPRVFFADVVERIAEVALAPPKQLIGLNEWSLPKLRQYLIEQGVVKSISIEHLRQLLRQREVRWRRTKTWKESTDPDFVPKWRAIRRLYRRPPKNGRVLCVDEFGPLKKFALNSSDHRSHAEQEAAIMSDLAWRNRRRSLSVQPLRRTKARNRAA